MPQIFNTAVFVDASVADVQHLVDGVLPGITVRVLSADKDGVAEISDYLRANPAQTVHIIAHGAPGSLYLGNTELSLGTLAEYSGQLATWFRDVNQSTGLWLEGSSQKASLYLYGCNVAAGDAGEEFLAKLNQLTQANIAASTGKVGPLALGGSWDLDAAVGRPQISAVLDSETMTTYAGTFAVNQSFVVLEDNESPARNGIPDGDFNVLLGRNDELAPIEFNIITDVAATRNSFLFLSVFDVDRASGEFNLVTINGNELGFLEGQNELSFQTIFRIQDLSWLTTGTNFVEIDINVTDSERNWRAEISRAELLLNYDGSSLGEASVRFGETDSSFYDAGAPIDLTVEIDTALPSQTLRVESILRNPAGDAVAFDSRPGSANFQIAGTEDNPFTWRPTLPSDAVSGVWSIDTTVFDATTGDLQFINTETFSVGQKPHTDLNADGKSDIIWHNQTTGQIYPWFLDNGVLIGTNELAIKVFEPTWFIEGLGDFDNDGDEDDIAWRNYGTGENIIWRTDFIDGQVEVVGGIAIGNGPVPIDWKLQGVGDFSNDGFQDDLIFYNPTTGESQIWFMDDSALSSIQNFDSAQAVAVGTGWEIGGVGSFDNDGFQDDIFWRNSITGENVIWLLDDGNVVGTASLPTVGTDWVMAGVSDFNSDFSPSDLLWRSASTSSTTIWLLDGTTLTGTIEQIQPAVDASHYVTV